jgi:polyhydroxyalkanoate synthesis regulator phasin
MTDNNLNPSRHSLIEVLREGFFQTLGKITVSKEAAESAVNRTVNRLVELGKVTQDEARNFTSDLKNRIDKNRTELERRIDEGVSHAMTAVRFPKREELEALKERVIQLEQLLDQLQTTQAKH